MVFRCLNKMKKTFFSKNRALEITKKTIAINFQTFFHLSHLWLKSWFFVVSSIFLHTRCERSTKVSFPKIKFDDISRFLFTFSLLTKIINVSTNKSQWRWKSSLFSSLVTKFIGKIDYEDQHHLRWMGSHSFSFYWR